MSYKHSTCFSLFVMTCLFLGFTKEEKATRYIQDHLLFAQEVKDTYGIPIAVCLAQAILETGYGESPAAKETNSHFNIKCHSDWTGEKISRKDDDRDSLGNLIESCFRKYDSVKDSYIDYGKYLTNKARYQSLLSIPASDYQAWANGLVKAGYATDSLYAVKLVKIIEDNNLNRYDLESNAMPSQKANVSTPRPILRQNSADDGYFYDELESFPGENSVPTIPQIAPSRITAASNTQSLAVNANTPTKLEAPPCPSASHAPIPFKTRPKFSSFVLR